MVLAGSLFFRVFFLARTKALYTMASYRCAMATTIQVSEKLVAALKQRKLYGKESYEEVIWDALEESKELNEETKRAVMQARAEIRTGKFHTHEQVRKSLGL